MSERTIFLIITRRTRERAIKPVVLFVIFLRLNHEFNGQVHVRHSEC